MRRISRPDDKGTIWRRKLAFYEAPFIVDGTRAPISKDYRARIGESVFTGRRGDAVRLLLKAVGVPSPTRCPTTEVNAPVPEAFYSPA